MKSSLDRIREAIAELEETIASLRVAERELQGLERTSPTEPRAPRAEKGSRGKVRPTPAAVRAAPEAQTIAGAIAAVLDPRDGLAVADIAARVKAAGREIDNRGVSFALQAMKKKGLVKNGKKGWLLGKPRRKSAGEAAPAAERRRQPEQEQKAGARQTVAEAVAAVLHRSGPLALSDLALELRAAGREVAGGTLSNTLQIMKKRGAVTSADGKWAA